MPGNSTCHVQKKLDLQGESMPDFFFQDAQDVVCPVTTVSHIMRDYNIKHVDLLKVSQSFAGFLLQICPRRRVSCQKFRSHYAWLQHQASGSA